MSILLSFYFEFLIKYFLDNSISCIFRLNSRFRFPFCFVNCFRFVVGYWLNSGFSLLFGFWLNNGFRFIVGFWVDDRFRFLFGFWVDDRSRLLIGLWLRYLSSILGRFRVHVSFSIHFRYMSDLRSNIILRC